MTTTPEPNIVTTEKAYYAWTHAVEHTELWNKTQHRPTFFAGYQAGQAASAARIAELERYIEDQGPRA